MLLRESVQLCAACAEVTPHSRRIVALPKLFGTAAMIGAGASFLRAWWLLGGILLWLGVFVLLRDREKFWRISCERCRGKELAAFRRRKPTLDGTTEINV